METIEQSVLLLSLAILLAIGVERLMEIMRSIHDYVEARSDKNKKWKEKAESLRDLIEMRLDNAKQGDQKSFNIVLLLVSRYLSPASSQEGGLIAVSTDKLRKMQIKIRYKIVAIVLGIALAWLFCIDMFQLVEDSVDDPSWIDSMVPPWLGITITGIAIGFGAGPMHKIITALERARDTRK